MDFDPPEARTPGVRNEPTQIMPSGRGTPAHAPVWLGGRTVAADVRPVPPRTAGLAPAWRPGPVAVPPCDVLDEGEEVVCHIELPGVRRQDIELACVGQVLYVGAVRRSGTDPVLLVHCERGAETLHARAVPLPFPVRGPGAQAVLRDGVLTVRLPKVEPTGPGAAPAVGPA